MVCKFFNKKSSVRGVATLANESMSNQLQLSYELHKPIIRKFKRKRFYSLFKEIRYLLCAIDTFCKYAWVVPFITIANAFQSFLDSSKRKPNKIWVDQGNEFYNSPFKKWLKDNDIEMYSTHNKGKSLVAERFIRTLKNKVCKHMTPVPKNVYFNILDDIVDKYNNTYHRTIKMKPIDVKRDSYTKYSVESNEKDPKFQFGDHVRI